MADRIDLTELTIGRTAPTGLLDSLARDQLAVDFPWERELVDVLDEWLHRQHGLLSGSHGVGLLLELLDEHGLAVMRQGDDRG